jgi:hypothetical protein
MNGSHKLEFLSLAGLSSLVPSQEPILEWSTRNMPQTLDLPQRSARCKRSSLLGQFVSYIENKVLRIWPQGPEAVFLVVCDPAMNKL